MYIKQLVEQTRFFRLLVTTPLFVLQLVYLVLHFTLNIPRTLTATLTPGILMAAFTVVISAWIGIKSAQMEGEEE